MSALAVRLRALRVGARHAWAQFRRNRLALIGLVVIAVFGVAAVLHPILMGWIWPTGVYDPLTGFDPAVLHPAPPGPGHLLGTDPLGRDVLSQLLSATGPTFVLSVVAAFTTAILATASAALAAYYSRWTDRLLSGVSDALLLLPAPVFMVIIGSDPQRSIGPVLFGLIYGVIAGLGAGAIVVRAQAVQIMVTPFIDAARVAGGGAARIIVRHVVPHLFPLAALFMMISVVGAVVADGFISFLGQTSVRLSWGTMVAYAVTFRNPITGAVAWNSILPPSIALSLFAAAFYLVSVGLREVADPRFRAEYKDQD